jgi:hypothetical protein
MFFDGYSEAEKTWDGSKVKNSSEITAGEFGFETSQEVGKE